MMVRFNTRFRKLVGSNFNIEEVKECTYPLLSDEEQIVEVEGCYYFKKFALKGKLSDRLNKMEYEFDTNKIRVDDLAKSTITSIESFWCGLSIVKNLTRQLRSTFGNDFEIILSYNYQHCFVRFYKIRAGVNNVMSDDLEGFKSEAVLRVVI